MRERFEVAAGEGWSQERLIELRLALALHRWAAALQALCRIRVISYTLRTTMVVGGW